MDQEQKPHWWRNTNPVLLVVSALIFILAFISIIVDDMIGTGPGKISFWEWLGVLIIPFALLGAGILLHNEQVRYEEVASTQRAQDDALRQYLDQMSALMIDERLREQPENSDARLLAQARTTTILLELDNTRKRRPLKLIYRLHLINRAKPVFTLDNAALDNADLSEVTLRDACLKGLDLRRADLRGADLLPYDAQDPAKLNSFNLNGVDPRNIDLRGDSLKVTNLSGAILSDAELSGANLDYVNLNDAKGVTQEQLAACKSLKDATMPNGQKYEDWLNNEASLREEES